MDFSFPDIFSKKSSSVIGVDIGSSSIKVVQLRREKGRAVLETYGAIALGPYASVEVGRATQLPAETLATALKDIIREANVTTADAGLAIPYSASLVSIVTLPAAVEHRLKETMPLEARKYIPVPISEVQLDWTLIGPAPQSPGGQEKIEVMLVAIHNRTVEEYRRIAATAGLSAAFLEIEVFSAARASLDHGIAPVAVIDIGAATSKFYIVERGIVRESHIINRGSQELTLALARGLNISVAQAEERKRKEGLTGGAQSQLSQSLELSLAPLFSELSRTSASFEARMKEPLSAAVFTGGGATMPGFGAYAASKLSTEVRLADPFGKTDVPAFLESTLKEAGPEFSVAVGLALRRLQDIG